MTYILPSGSGSLANGDYGDVTVSNSGGTITIDPAAVSSAKTTNQGNAVGRLGSSVLIDRTSLSAAASYAPTAFAAGAYRRLWFTVSARSGTATGITMALTSVTGTVKLSALYTSSAAPTTAAATGSADWSIGMGATPWDIDGSVGVETGGIRKLVADAVSPDGLGAGSMLCYRMTGYAADTTHDVTGFSVAFTGGTVTGIGELWGVPF